MTPREELVPQYKATGWARSYNGFSGVDFMVQTGEGGHPGMAVQAVSYAHEKTGDILFISVSESGPKQGDRFDLELRATHPDEDYTFIMVIQGCKIMEPVVADKGLTFVFDRVKPWERVK